MLFSIIMPVYNAEQFLEKSIQSVLAQTYPGWELLLLNDGSQDRSDEIITQYAAADCRIRAFSHKNMGVSKTRNRGIKEAKGDYILFVDADDELDARTLDKIYRTLQEVESDVIVFNAYRCDLNSNVTGVFTSPLSEQVLYLNGEKDKRDYIYSILASDKPFGFCWNFAVKRMVLEDVRFPTDMIMCEDLIFDIRMYEKAASIIYLPDCFYFYRDNPSGCVRNFNFRKIEDLKKAYEAKLNLIEKYNLQQQKAATVFFCMSIVSFYFSMLEDSKLCKRYIKTVREDGYVLKQFELSRELQCTQVNSAGRILFGNAFQRMCLRFLYVAKRKIKMLLKL